MYFTEDLIKELAAEGFNYVRVELDARIIFSKNRDEYQGYAFNGNSENVNLLVLKNIDDLITRGACFQTRKQVSRNNGFILNGKLLY